MKRSWAALAVIFIAHAAVAGCNDYGNTFQNPTGAGVSFISPTQTSACIPAPASNSCLDLTLTLTGSGFVAQTKVQWNRKNLVTTVPVDGSGTVLGNIVTAVVPYALLEKPGLATVNTLNPASGAGQNGLSNTINFIINNPGNLIPAVTSLSAACAQVGNSLALTVNGTNFLTGTTDKTQISSLNWTLNGSQYQFTSFASITGTQIVLTIPASDITAVGAATVTVYNPPSLPLPNVPGSAGSGGGTSAATAMSTLTVQAAVCPLAPKSNAKDESTIAVGEETPAVSLDGRYVAFTAEENGHSHILLRDTCEGVATGCTPYTALLSVASDGSEADADSHSPSMSADSRFVAFSSIARNLVEDAPTGRQIYLRDTCAGTSQACKPATYLISTDTSGALVGTESILPSISSSGRFVAFLAITPSHLPESASASETNSGLRQVFIRDTCLGAANCTPKTTRVSLQPGDGAGSPNKPAGPALSGNARNVALPGGNTAMLFTRSVAVDDRVFLAATNAALQK